MKDYFLEPFFIQKTQIDWQPDIIKQVYDYTVTPFLRNFPTVASKVSNYFNEYSASQNLLSISNYGDLHAPNHMFRYDVIDWGFKFNEPHMTKGLVNFLSQSSLACWLFVKALFESEHPKNDIESKTFCEDEKEYFLRSMSITSEKVIDNHKRLDILITWCSHKNEKNLIIIECKFNHFIEKKQLPNYRNYAVSQTSFYDLFVLSHSLDKKSLRMLNNHHNKEWRQVQWVPFLKRFEKLLTTEQSFQLQGFENFRRTLWDKAAKA